MVPGQQLYAHLFGSGGPQLLEVVAQAGEAARARAGPHAVGRPIPRYGPPPSSLPLPVFAVDPGRPSTSRQVRSLLEGRLAERPSMDGQILQLAAGELSLAMDRAQVRFQFPEIVLFCNLAYPLLELWFLHADVLSWFEL